MNAPPRTIGLLAPVLLLAGWMALELVRDDRSAPSPGEPIHLFLLSGQSNMHHLDPEVSFVPAIEAEFGADRVLVVKDAAGGQPIWRWIKGWKPSTGEAPAVTGDLYERLLTRTGEAIERQSPDRREIASVTLVWMQGERDARLGHADVYEDSLRRLRHQLSEDLHRDSINFVVGRLSDFDLENERYPHWTRIREAQAEFVRSNPRCALVGTDDLNDGENFQGKVVSDDLHYSIEGYRILGQRFARRAIDLIRGARRPDIILVMADDQGFGDTGYNSHPFVQTPNLDAMARDGFVFDRFYAAAPVCSPTRASVLTGRTPVRAKVPNHGRYMRPEEWTLAEALKDAGYVTGMFGKFHLGSAQPDSPCNPSGAGFDEWCIGLNFFDQNPYLSRQGVVEPRKGTGTELVVDDALDFLARHKDGDAPMFTVVWFPSPHDPHNEVPASDEGDAESLYEGEKGAGYYREITLLDQQVGRLRRELRSLGIADDTILWYCSDNGGLVAETSGGRARKGSVYEGGLRVPSIVEWPARSLQGRASTPVSTSDMLPTLLSLAGVPLDSPHPLDGTDVSLVFEGDARRARPIGFWHRFQGGQVTRSDQILRAIYEKQVAGAPLPHDPPRMLKDVEEFPQFAEDYTKGHAAWADWPFKLHRIEGDRYELYNLEKDPMEQRNLAEERVHREHFERMKAELDAWMRSVIQSVNGEDY